MNPILFSTRKSFIFYLLTRIILPTTVVISVIYLVLTGYKYLWTGFQNKTLWDWIDLLIVPLVLAIASWTLGRFEKNIESNISADRFRETTIQSYLSQMNLILSEQRDNLEKPNSPINQVANLNTENIFQFLSSDIPKKKVVLLYLYKAGLLQVTDVKQLNSILHIENLDFAGINLERISLNQSCLQNCYFKNANLRFSNLSECNFDESKFSKASLTGALLIGSSFQNSRFDYAILDGIVANRVNFSHALLYQSSLQLATLTEGVFEGASLTKSLCHNAYFDGANLSYASLDNSDLRSASFSSAIMIGCVLKKAKAQKAVFREANLTGEADLSEGDFRFADFSGARMEFSILVKSNFHGANFQFADLSDSDLSFADFSYANFYKADLSGAKLYKTNLYGVSMENVKITPEQMAQIENKVVFSPHFFVKAVKRFFSKK